MGDWNKLTGKMNVPRGLVSALRGSAERQLLQGLTTGGYPKGYSEYLNSSGGLYKSGGY